MEPAIETKYLGKAYKGFVAVKQLNLIVPRGEVFGFLGPNGAGKTTTIMMLLGNIKPTAGMATLLGKPVGDVETRRRVGFLPEKFQFHEFLTAVEFLHLHGKLAGMSREARDKRIPIVLARVGLADRANNKIQEFSKGMQQRIGLAQAILHELQKQRPRDGRRALRAVDDAAPQNHVVRPPVLRRQRRESM